MKMEETGPLYARVGEIVMEGIGPLENRTALYASVENGSVGITIAEDRGNYVFYHRLPDPEFDDLVDALIALWRLRKRGDRWREMSYQIENGQFHAKLFYPDELDPKESSDDRADKVITELFGDKPAQCDPLEPSDWEGYTFKL